jgi:hypothetical protein
MSDLLYLHMPQLSNNITCLLEFVFKDRASHGQAAVSQQEGCQSLQNLSTADYTHPLLRRDLHLLQLPSIKATDFNP